MGDATKNQRIRSSAFASEVDLIGKVLAGNISRRDFMRSATLLGISFPVIATVLDACGTSTSTATPTGIPQVSVSYANLPVWDTSVSVIGVAQGWYQNVGITLTPPPHGIALNSTDDAVAVYSSGRYDVINFPSEGYLPAINTVPPVNMFALTSIYQANELIAQPNQGFKSYQELVASGIPADAAMKQAINQVKGKRYCYPTDPPLHQFITVMLNRGGLTPSDYTPLVNVDQVNVALMQSGKADFMTGAGAASSVLRKAGFKIIVNAAQLGATAKASVDSPELSALVYNGLSSPQSWVNTNHDTVLRMTSVMLRINQQINDHPEVTIPIHVPFLNSIAGTNFTHDDAIDAYTNLDPFLTFDRQQAIFNDDSNSLNLKYVYGATIKSYETQGVIKGGQYGSKLSDITTAPAIYNEMVTLKSQADQNIKDTTSAITAITDASSGTKIKAEQLLAQAKLYYDAFDFLDAQRFSHQAVTAAKG